jgi:hypothetical protein
MHKLLLSKGVRPLSFLGQGFQLSGQRIEDTDADYRTVMANREHLRDWCNDTWPEDEFTVEQNREDLMGHISEAEEEFAYGYTVWNPDEKEVLGSVYLYPASFFAERYKLSEPDRQRLQAHIVLVDYWLAHQLEKDGEFHRQFILMLKDWLNNEWGFKRAAWATRPAMEERRNLYESVGFRGGQLVESSKTPGWYQAFHLSSA